MLQTKPTATSNKSLSGIKAKKNTVPQWLASSLCLASGLGMAAETPLQLASLEASDTVIVTGVKDGDFTAKKMDSTKFTQPLLDTPQTLVVVKKEILQQEAATNLSEGLRNTPGITLLMGENGNTATGDAIFMRGFDTQGSIFVDGIRDLGTISRDTFNVDQIEIAKGPAGVDNGRGAASGYVNLVSKKANNTSSTDLDFTVGSGEYRRTTLDNNNAFNNGTALRINLVRQLNNVDGRDEIHNGLTGVASSLGFGLNSDTKTFLNLQHIEQNSLPDGGVPTVGLDGYYSSVYATAFPNNSGPKIEAVDSKNFYGSLQDFNRVKSNMFTLRVERTVSDELSWYNTTRFARSEQSLQLTGVNALVIPNATKNDLATWEVARMRQGKLQTNEILTHQSNLVLSNQLLGMKQDLSGGVEIIDESQNTKTLVTPWMSTNSTTHVTQANAKLYSPNLEDFFQPLISDGTKIDGSTTTFAIYALETLSPTEKLKFSVGFRAEHYITETNQIIRHGAATPQTIPIGTLLGREARAEDDLISWKLGAVYKPVEEASVYFSYATSQLPPGSNNFLSQGAFALNTDTSSVTANNANLDPQKGVNEEIGFKWDIFNKKLSFTSALFKSINENEIVTNPDTSVTPVGTREVKGVEFGLVGILMRNWQVSAGLAIMDPKIKNGSTGSGTNLASTTGGDIQWSPKKTFTLWNSFQINSAWSVGGGARYVDSMVSTSVVDPTKLATRSLVTVPEYWVYDAMTAYKINRNIQVQFNIQNLTNETYIATVNNAGSRFYPGTPRAIRLTCNVNF